MGLSEGCQLKRDIQRDEAISYADVVRPEGRLADRLRTEQDEYFAKENQSSPRGPETSSSKPSVAAKHHVPINVS